MGLSLAHGGHLSHGMKINVSGRLYEIAAYEVDRDSSLIDMDEVAESRASAARSCWSPAGPPIHDSSTSRASARSPTRSARY